MTPDLGRYALEVTLAYAGTLVALVTLVAVSVRQARHARRALEDAEGRRRDG